MSEDAHTAPAPSQVPTKAARWQATVKRLCLYMFIVPIAAGVMMWRGVGPLTVLLLASLALFGFIAVILVSYLRLQD